MLIRLIYSTISHRPATGGVLNSGMCFLCLCVLSQRDWSPFNIFVVAIAQTFPSFLFVLLKLRFGDTEGLSKNIRTPLSTDKPKIVNRCYFFPVKTLPRCVPSNK